MGNLTWFNLLAKFSVEYEAAYDNTNPAAAMEAKSDSVIHVSQCFLSAAVATFGSWSWPNVHSSTMASFPVASNNDGVIHG